MTDNDVLKDKYKHISSEELASYNLLSPAKSTGYICPFCGNGSGEDGTGIEFNLLNTGYEGYCHKCHTNFDVFKIIAHENHLDVSTQFVQVFDFAKKIFGDDVSKIKIAPAAQKEKKPKKDYFENLKKWRANLKGFVTEQGGNFRGLLYEQLAKYYCGYEPKFYSKVEDKKENRVYEFYAPRFIVPSNRNHFLARFVGNFADLNLPANVTEKDIKPKQHFGSKTIFGVNMIPKDAKIIFVTEGEFDAMSIDQCGYPAVSVSGSKITGEMQEEWKNFSHDIGFVILLDNDETGEKNADENAKIIDSLGYHAAIQFLDKKYKDANEFLQADPDGLAKNLEEIFQEVKKLFKNAPPPAPAVEKAKELPAPPAIVRGSTTKFNMPDCPIDLNLPQNFSMTEKGIYIIKEITDAKGEVTQNVIKVTDTPVVITKVVETPERTDGQLEIAVYNRRNKKWDTHIIKRTDASDSKKMTQLAEFGVSVTTGRSKMLSEYLNDLQYYSNNILLIPCVQLYKRPGWTDDSCTKFVFPPGDGKTFIVQNSNFNYKEAYTIKGDPVEWLNVFKDIYRIAYSTRLAQGFALAAPLLKPCNVRNFQFLLEGTSGSGKSALLEHLASIYGNPSKLRRTFNTTGNSLDASAEMFNDLFSWADEFQSAGKALRENIQTNVYNFAEGLARQKLTKDSNQRPYTNFRGMRGYTAEQPILTNSAGQGAIARMITLNGKDIFTNDFAVKLHKFFANNYGHYIREWIDYVIGHKAEIAADYEYYLSNYNVADPLTGRPKYLPATIQLVAISHTALLHFCKMLGIDKELDVAAQIPKDFYAMIGANIIKTTDETKNVSRAMQLISELRFTHEKYFYIENKLSKTVSNYEGVQFTPPSLAPILGVKYLKKTVGGWSEDGDVAFAPGQLKKILRDAGFPSAEAIIDALIDDNLITPGRNKQKPGQVSKRYGDKTGWFYHFPAETFEKFDQ